MKHYITIGEKYGPAMEITTQEEADTYFENCVEHCMTVWGEPRAEAERIERGNLGYYAGYYSNDVRLRVERLFCGVHPILGSAQNPPTAEEAFKKGLELEKPLSRK